MYSTVRLFVLIETSWNVKNIPIPNHNIKTGINRNIVECKGVPGAEKAFQISVLIETSWNVKYGDKRRRAFAFVVLIETSWNVKEFWTIPSKCMICINRNIVECKVRKKPVVYARGTPY